MVRPVRAPFGRVIQAPVLRGASETAVPALSDFHAGNIAARVPARFEITSDPSARVSPGGDAGRPPHPLLCFRIIC